MSTKQFIIASLAASAILAAQVSPIPVVRANESTSTIEYVEKDASQAELTSPAVESLSMEDINVLEGIPQEQIVVAIEADGYVTSHGDHFHFYNGPLPADALFSEDIQTPEDYHLNEGDIVGEIHGAKIVMIDGAYAIYNELGQDHPGLRTIEEIYLQSFSVHPDDARALVDLLDLYDLPTDSEIFYETDRLLEELTAELQEKESQIGDPVMIYMTPEEYAVLLGMDIYVLPGEPAEDIPVSELFVTQLNYDLDPADILFETQGGLVVKIDGKHYFHPTNREQLTVVAVHQIQESIQKAHQAFLAADGQRADDKHMVVSGSVLHESGSRNSRGQYVTDDGYVFSPYHVLRDTGTGYIVPHDDHFHFIPKSDLTPEEIAIADRVLGKASSAGTSSEPTGSNLAQEIPGDDPAHRLIQIEENSRYHQESDYVTSDGYRFTVESVTQILDDGILGRHDDHFHYVPFAHLNKKELAALQSYAKDAFGVILKLPGEVSPQGPADQNSASSHKADLTQPALSIKKDQGNSRNEQGRLVAADGFVFSPAGVVGKVAGGYIAPHDDHFHFIPASQMTPEEIRIAEATLANRKPKPLAELVPAPGHKKVQPIKPNLADSDKHLETPPAIEKPHPSLAQEKNKEELAQDGKPSTLPAEDNKPSPAAPSSPEDGTDLKVINIFENPRYHQESDYVTSDGYRFTVESVTQILDDGILGRHDDHFHYVPFAHLNKKELTALQSYAKDAFGVVLKLPGQDAPQKPTVQDLVQSQDPEPEKPALTIKKDQENTRNEEGHLVAGDGFIFNPREVIRKIAGGYVAPHDDHFHFIPASEMTAEEIEIAEATLASKKPKPLAELVPAPANTEDQPAKPAEPGESEPGESEPVETEPPVEIPTPGRIEEDSSEADAKKDLVTEPEEEQITPQNEEESREEAPEQGTQGEKSQPTIPTLESLLSQKRSEKGEDGEPYETSDGYIFDVSTVKHITSDAIIALHDGPDPHDHYIPLFDLDANELRALAEAGWLPSEHGTPSQPNADIDNEGGSEAGDKEDAALKEPAPLERTEEEKAQIKEFEALLEEIHKKPSFQRYYRTDGFYFDPTQVTGKTDTGYKAYAVIDGKKDERVVPFKELKSYEIEAAELRLAITDYEPSIIDPLSQGVIKTVKPMKRNDQGGFDGLSLEDIRFNIDQLSHNALLHVTNEKDGLFIQPHNDHIHTLQIGILNKDSIDFTRFLIQNPQYVPENNSGWGREADIYLNPEEYDGTTTPGYTRKLVRYIEVEEGSKPEPEEKTESPKEEKEVSEEKGSKPEPASTPLTEPDPDTLKTFIAETYAIPEDQIHYHRGLRLFLFRKPESEENIRIKRQDALAAYHGQKQLPLLETQVDTAEDNKTMNSEESEPADTAQETSSIETLTAFLAGHYEVTSNQVSYSSGSFTIQLGHGSPLTISYDLAQQAYQTGDKSGLPQAARGIEFSEEAKQAEDLAIDDEAANEAPEADEAVMAETTETNGDTDLTPAVDSHAEEGSESSNESIDPTEALSAE